MASRHLSRDELNKVALEHFVYQPVGRDMIAYLADAAHNVIACDSALYPADCADRRLPPTPPRSPVDDSMPSLEDFITQLVVSSNVQVPTLMSTLVYLTRLKSKLQPMARGLRCTTHRIFLASLILAAKYLNDSSPKNKHWANYTHVTTNAYTFGFNRTEVNLMEKQLLFLLEWELRITEHDLYRELDVFLEPLRVRIVERHARKMRQREEKRRQQDLCSASSRYPSPASSRGSSRSRNASPDQARGPSSTGSLSPPGLTFSSSSSSYASSVASSRQQSRSTTPLGSEPGSNKSSSQEPRQAATPYDSPVEIVVDSDLHRGLAYELSPDEYLQLQESSAKKRHKRGVWGRLLGGAVAVR
ncbi:hypothetical protein XA68_10490 [Ophiocordyceps unilateralis]|uniref:Cyclin-like domain-containing protein n=1 Tax=Ophiocordyceps unilateralis TaxID=268505 RepID=A0A2A9NYV6_OPHUN|nr:hypothetical protein XA68_10490 [Ophiocordyceps unilateralis]